MASTSRCGAASSVTTKVIEQQVYLRGYKLTNGTDAEDVLELAQARLARAGREDEVVLWFEHDLFDQAILVFLLDRLADLHQLTPHDALLLQVAAILQRER